MSGCRRPCRTEILAVVQADGPLNGYRVPRKNYFCGRWIRHLGWYPDYTLRLFRRDQGRFRDREVHEEVVVDGPVGTLQDPSGPLQLPQSVSEYVARMDRYARLAARELAKRGRRPWPGRTLLPALFHLSPSLFHPAGVFWKARRAMTLAVLMSMYKFLKYYYLRELTRGRDLDGH